VRRLQQQQQAKREIEAAIKKATNDREAELDRFRPTAEAHKKKLAEAKQREDEARAKLAGFDSPDILSSLRRQFSQLLGVPAEDVPPGRERLLTPAIHNVMKQLGID